MLIIQNLMHDDETNLDPFVGLIISTFDIKLPSPVSCHQWFHVSTLEDPRSVSKKSVTIPMKLEVTIPQFKADVFLRTERADVSEEEQAHFVNMLRGNPTAPASVIDGDSTAAADGVVGASSVGDTKEDLTASSSSSSSSSAAAQDSRKKLNEIFCLVCSHKCTCNSSSMANSDETAHATNDHAQNVESGASVEGNENGNKDEQVDRKLTLEEEMKKIQADVVDCLFNDRPVRASRGVKQRNFYDDRFS